MSVAQVVSRISQIRQQFSSVHARSGFELPTADDTQVDSAGVIGGRIGATATPASVRALQGNLGMSNVVNLASPLAEIEVTSGWGDRVHPIHGDVRMHDGADLTADLGDPVHSVADGLVSFAGERGGYGNLVIVDHGGGFETRYAHQQELYVSTGDLVRSGELVGSVGSTGASTGPHLHFEVRRDGQSVDPSPWLA
jgi:murein DD-endopeptidase MepM/ murein hydrolase activator NlpD